MAFKIGSLIFLISVFGLNNATICEENLTGEKLLNQIDQNQSFGAECSQYTNKIESFLNDYKQIYNSLSISCQLHVQTAIKNVKITIDEMMDEKIDEHIKYLIEIKNSNVLRNNDKSHLKYESELTSLKVENVKLKDLITQQNKTFEGEIKEIQTKLNQTLIDKENFNNKIVTCESDLSIIKSNLSKTIEEYSIKQNLRNLNINAINALRKGDFNIAHKLLKDSNESELRDFISAAYDKNILNAGKVIEFLNTLSSEEKIIYGYRVLFDQMKLNQQEFSAPTTTIAYRAFVDLNQSHSNNENILYLRKYLPEQLRKFVWNKTVKIVNAEMPNECVFVGSAAVIDTSRQLTFTYPCSSNFDYIESFLIPVLNGSYFYIHSKYNNLQFYAETEKYIMDNQRRRTFTWTLKNEIKDQGRWQLEPVQGSTTHFKIKNIYYNEYLAIENGFSSPQNQYSTYNQLFTTPINLCQNKYCEWSFIRWT